MSIRRTLLVSLVGGLLAGAIIIPFASYFNAAEEMRELFSDSMKRMAIVVKEQVFAKSDIQKDVDSLASDEPEESSVIQIWDDKGRLLHSLPQEIALPLQPQEGFGKATLQGQTWSTFTLKAGNDGFIQVAQPRHIIGTMIEESAIRTLIPLIVLFILLGLGAWFVINKSLLSLSHLSRLIASQNIDQLSPLSVSEVPDEVQPIVKAINRLLERLDQAMALQRQFTADAAHELRTPLTAIKIQAELLDRTQSPVERKEAMKKLSEGIERGINMATQLLSASRAAIVKPTFDFQVIRLDHIVKSCVTSFVPVASLKEVKITFDPCDKCNISADEEGIRILVNNLLDNAVRHTKPGGTVNISLCIQDRKPVLKIADAGPGIIETEKNKIFQRFYRVPGTSSSGAGLGLSIVKDIASNHQAVVTVGNGPNNIGTTFCVVFRPQPAKLAA